MGTGATLLLDQRGLTEFARIATVKLKVDAPTLTRAERFFHEYAVVLPAADLATVGVPDPNDAWIIAAALAANARWFVTGDQALLNLNVIAAMPILSPRMAYQRLIELP